MRLIDAELLKRTTERLIKEEEQNGFYPKSWDEEVIAFKCLIDSMPAIEAKPVVNAYWIKGDDGKYCCHNCGYPAEGNIADYAKLCPVCGAQMYGNSSEKTNGSEGVKIPVISMEDVPKIMEEMENNV